MCVCLCMCACVCVSRLRVRLCGLCVCVCVCACESLHMFACMSFSVLLLVLYCCGVVSQCLMLVAVCLLLRHFLMPYASSCVCACRACHVCHVRHVSYVSCVPFVSFVPFVSCRTRSRMCVCVCACGCVCVLCCVVCVCFHPRDLCVCHSRATLPFATKRQVHEQLPSERLSVACQGLVGSRESGVKSSRELKGRCGHLRLVSSVPLQINFEPGIHP